MAIILARPIICRLLPKIIQWISRLLSKGIELISYPVMVWLNSLIVKRRNEDNYYIPAWIEFIEDSFSVSIKVLNLIAKPSQKRSNNRARIKKGFRVVGLILALLIPTAIVNNPTEPYAKTWGKFESWVTNEKLQTVLGYNLTSLQAKTEETSVPVKQAKITLTERFKDEGANIRETPSLNGNIIDSLVADETATFLDEEKTDSNGIKWLKVETSTGAVGWISSRIVEEE
jgi:hypothetical protein